MSNVWHAIFGARGQVVLGIIAFIVSCAFWVIGCFVIPGALAAPWQWTPEVFIFHASMFALFVASLGYIGTGLGYKATERVEAQVAEVEHADEVNVKS